METVTHATQSSSHRKSPRKSTTSSEDRIKLGLVEQQMAELKETHEERIDELKDEAADLSKQLASSNCDNLKLKSEMKTLGMTEVEKLIDSNKTSRIKQVNCF